MTRYGGGKKRIAKEIHKVIKYFEAEHYPNQKLIYYEAFAGMASVALEFARGDREVIITDFNPDITAFWTAVQQGWLPSKKLRNITHKRYNAIKESPTGTAERAFVGSVFSYAGMMFAKFSGLYQSKELTQRSFDANLENIRKVYPLTEKMKILDSRSYNDPRTMEMMSKGGYLCFCDPPYLKSLKSFRSAYFNKFNHDQFWETMRLWSKNNLVFISEDLESKPDDFVCIWSKQLSRVIYHKKQPKNCKQATDCLFVHESILARN